MNDSIKEALRDVVNNCDKESRVSSQMEISAYIYSIEQQNKALADMVETLTEKIERLGEPKTCDGCSHEKQSSPLYIHCFGCNRMKTLIDKYHDKNTPCRE